MIERTAVAPEDQHAIDLLIEQHQAVGDPFGAIQYLKLRELDIDDWIAVRAIQAARAPQAELRAAVCVFLAKWDLVEPGMQNAFAIAHIHGIKYQGPTIEAELINLRALAKAIEAGTGSIGEADESAVA